MASSYNADALLSLKFTLYLLLLLSLGFLQN